MFGVLSLKYTGGFRLFLYVQAFAQVATSTVLILSFAGIPHALTEDDVYNGVFLPKGSVVMPNVWSITELHPISLHCQFKLTSRHMLHDPAIYPGPGAFKPERYGGLDSEMKKVTDLAFGFGRRACPGYHFAEGTIFSIVATVLATCDVVPVVGEHGQKIIPDIRYTTGAIM